MFSQNTFTPNTHRSSPSARFQSNPILRLVIFPGSKRIKHGKQLLLQQSCHVMEGFNMINDRCTIKVESMFENQNR